MGFIVGCKCGRESELPFAKNILAKNILAKNILTTKIILQKKIQKRNFFAKKF